MEITKKRLIKAFRRFDDYADDVGNANPRTFDAYFQVFMNFCENDEIVSFITVQLKSNSNVDAKKWSEECKTHREMILVIDEEDRLALFYKFMLGVYANEISLSDFWILVFGGTRYDELIYDFNRQIFDKFVRDLKYKLEELEEELQNKEEVTREDLIIFNHYDVNVINKGIMAIGNGNIINGNRIIMQKLITEVLSGVDESKLLPDNIVLLDKLHHQPDELSKEDAKNLFEDIINKFPEIKDKAFSFLKSIPSDFTKTVIIDVLKSILGI